MKTGTELTPAQQAAAAILSDRSISGRFTRLKTHPLKWEEQRGYVLQLVEQNESLNEAVRANPKSLELAMYDIASYGITLNPTLGYAYLIPERINKVLTVCAKVSYKGFEYAAKRSGSVFGLQTELVYTKDFFKRGVNENGPFVQFEQARGERGDLEGGFCWSINKHGVSHVEWMSAKELEACRLGAIARANGKESPAWRGAFRNEMYKKCVARRAAKHWEMTTEGRKLLENLDRLEPVLPPTDIPDAITPMTQDHLKLVKDAIVALGIPPGTVESWMTLQSEAWGYKSKCWMDGVPDDEHLRLKDALEARAKKILEKRAKTEATP